VSWFRRKPQVPPRQPHPDPAIEQQLQRILSLRTAIGRQEALAHTYHDEIRAAQGDHESAAWALRNEAHFGTGDLSAADKSAARRIEAAQLALTGVEERITGLQDEISKRMADMSPSDLAYL